MRTLALAVLPACSVMHKDLAASRSLPDQISWPAAYAPDDAVFFVHNRIEIDAPPEVVWGVLVEAETWPDWYVGASDVVVQDGSGVLSEGAVFTWQTMGLDFTSTVTEWAPPHRLSWESEKDVIQGLHGWLLIPTGTGCLLVTDESQKGSLARLEKLFQPRKLRRLHDAWLAEIKQRSEARAATR